MILQNFLLAFPLFFLVGLGSFSAKVSLIDFNVGKGLAKFAFNIAIPCLLFQTIRGASNWLTSARALWFFCSPFLSAEKVFICEVTKAPFSG